MSCARASTGGDPELYPLDEHLRIVSDRPASHMLANALIGKQADQRNRLMI